MNKREARVKALELAYRAIQLIYVNGPDGEGEPKVEVELEKLAQAAYERWQRMKERS